MRKLLKKIGWYPVTFFGYIVTIIYTALLIHVVTKINATFYNALQEFFMAAVLSIFIVILSMAWAKIRGEKPFIDK